MTYRFGLFEFDGTTCELSNAGRRVPLEPQPGRALALLLSRAGETVTRDELRAHLWGADTHVDFDRGLAYCVGQLRTALRDSADNPRFIQTLPRRGFRFIASVSTLQNLPVISGTVPAPAAPSVDDQASKTPRVWPFGSGPFDFRAFQFLRFVRGTVPDRTLAAVTVGVLVLSVGIWTAVSRARENTRPLVAVAVFDNETGIAAYDGRVREISDVVVERLTVLGTEQLGVIGNTASLRRSRAERDLKAIAAETNASHIILGQLQNRSERVSLLMHLIKLDDDTHLWTQRVGRPGGDALTSLAEDAATEIQGAVRQFVLSQPSQRP